MGETLTFVEAWSSMRKESQKRNAMNLFFNKFLKILLLVFSYLLSLQIWDDFYSKLSYNNCVLDSPSIATSKNELASTINFIFS